jgi:GNAT superfamily N-acetyltransferase
VTDIEIRSTRYLAPAAQRMVAAALGDLSARYGGVGDDTPIDPMEFNPPEGGFFVAYRQGDPVGCAGWRSHEHLDGGSAAGEAAVAELKRLYVAPDARGAGVASALVAAVEQAVVDRGRTRLILECGMRQPEAIALYEKLGYARIPDFGYYQGWEGVRSFGRDLVPDPTT